MERAFDRVLCIIAIVSIIYVISIFDFFVVVDSLPASGRVLILLCSVYAVIYTFSIVFVILQTLTLSFVNDLLSIATTSVSAWIVSDLIFSLAYASDVSNFWDVITYILSLFVALLFTISCYNNNENNPKYAYAFYVYNWDDLGIVIFFYNLAPYVLFCIFYLMLSFFK